MSTPSESVHRGVSKTDPGPIAALKRAIAAADGQSELARRIGVKPQTVQQMLRKGVPAERAIQIERAVAGQVTRYELRPDIYPIDPPPAPAAAAN